MANNKRLYLSPPHMSGSEMGYVEDAFSSNWIAPTGPQVDAFENELALYLGVGGVLALVSGTAAIHLALKLLNVGNRDTVFCSALTFVASANPILYVGAKPVFIDSEPSTWNMSPIALADALADAEKQGCLPVAVIVVNLYGQSADMEIIEKLCKSYGVALIEDAAESLGATYQGRCSGSFGKFSVLSFNGNKIITTSGGGALVSGDIEALARAKHLSTQARLPFSHYEHDEVGYNYRLSNVSAAIGRGQLESLPFKVEAKRKIYEYYSDAFNGFEGISFMPESAKGVSSRWLTAITVDPSMCGVNRDQIIDALEAENIEARPVWKPMQLQPLYRGCKYYKHEPGVSVSDGLFNNGLCLPSGSAMDVEDQSRVVRCIKRLGDWL